MIKILDFLKKPRNRFIVKAVSLVVVWQVAYFTFILKYTNIDSWLTEKVGQSTGWVFNWLGFQSHFDGEYLFIDGVKSVFVADGCNGLGLFALFIGFILLTPGKIIYKVLYSIVGLSFIFFANLTRVYLLGVNYINSPSTFEFNHKYTYLWAVYLLVFALWMIWLEVINKKHFGKSAT